MLIVAIGRMIDGTNNRKVSENKTGVGYEILLDRIPPFIIHKKNNRKRGGHLLAIIQRVSLRMLRANCFSVCSV